MPVVRDSSLVNFLALNDAPELRADLLHNVVALLSMVADTCADRLLDTYDSVLRRLVDMTEPHVRADIARGLAVLRRAPDGIVRKLALDDIAIAHPLLVRSEALTESDLAGIAQLRGNPHRAVIATRPYIGVELGDIIVVRGDNTVRRALAANPTAAISRRAWRRMLAQARGDREMQHLIASHPAVPAPVLATLGRFADADVASAIANRTAERTSAPTTDQAADNAMFAVYDFEAAARRLEDWLEEGHRLNIELTGELAAGNRFDEAAVALARLSGFGLSEVLDWFASRDTRTVVLVVRALGGSEAALGGLLAAGSWRFRVSAEQRQSALAEFQALGIDAARALLEDQSSAA